MRVMEKTLKPKGAKGDDRARESISALEQQMGGQQMGVRGDDTAGIVTFKHDGVARVAGLAAASLGNVVRFDDGQIGIVCSLEKNDAAVLLLDKKSPAEGAGCHLEAGQLRLPVHLGGVMNGLGEPLGEGNSSSGSVLEVELTPLMSAERRSWMSRRGRVEEPLWTSISTIDLLAPLAHGQNVALIGDGDRGVEAAVRDIIMAQARGGDVVPLRASAPSHIVG